MTKRKFGVLAAAALAAGGPAVGAPAERLVEAQGPSGVLQGTMLAPAGGPRDPVVLIVPGSGPTDRDGNNPMGLKAAPYRLLAQALAERGVTTTRVDKRGMFASAGAVDPNAVTVADYAADVHAWARKLKSLTGARCIWVLGHSEGALVAEVAAQSEPVDLCGLVLVSGMGRKLGAVLRQQLNANPANAPLLPDVMRSIDKLEAGERFDATVLPAPLQPLFYNKVQGYLIDMLRRDPQALLRAYPGPVLVVQGTTDLQVTMEDAEWLVAARPGVRVAKIEGMNHVLKSAPAERGANIATYADPSLPLAPGVADAVAEFVKGNRR